MQSKKIGELEWLEFDLLANIPELVHGVFLRHGGVSCGDFSSLNMGKKIGDEESHVEENIRRAAAALDCSLLASVHQIHSKELVEVSHRSWKELPLADGLLTSDTGIGLMIKHADCQAALIYDPIHRVIGNIHCGWRGNVANIYREAIEKMKGRYGSNPADLLVCISPSLGPKAAEFKNYEQELPQDFWKFRVDYHFDLWAIAQMQLENSGVLRHHIEMSRICTYSNPKDWFSYRRDKPTGRHASIIKMR